MSNKKRRGLAGTVFQRGNKWAYAFDGPPDPLTGRRRRVTKSGYDTDDDAWAALAKAQADVRAGTFRKPSNRTVAEFFEEWFSANRGNVEATTASNYDTLARSYVIPVIGNKKLQAVDGRTVAALYDHLLTKGRRKKDTNSAMFEVWQDLTSQDEQVKPRDLAKKVGVSRSAAHKAVRRYQAGRTPEPTPAGLSKKSVSSVQIMLKSACADAVVWGYLATNPTIGVKGPSIQRRGHDVWSPQQLSYFLDAVKTERLYAMWVLVATTGMRRSEIAGLRLDSLDLDDEALRVRTTRVVTSGKVHAGHGKSHKSRRRLSLDKATIEVLRCHVKMIREEKEAWGEHYQDHGLMFCWEDGRPIYPDTITEQLGRLADRHGLPPLTVRGLRHTYATTALRAKVHPKVVSTRLGHAKVAFTLDVYTEDVPELDEAAAQEISDLFLHAPGFDQTTLEQSSESTDSRTDGAETGAT